MQINLAHRVMEWNKRDFNSCSVLLNSHFAPLECLNLDSRALSCYAMFDVKFFISILCSLYKDKRLFVKMKFSSLHPEKRGKVVLND